MQIPIAHVAQLLNTNIGIAKRKLKGHENGGYVSLEELTDWVEKTYSSNPLMYDKWLEILKHFEQKAIKENQKQS